MESIDWGGLIAAVIALIVALTGTVKVFNSLISYIKKKAAAGDEALKALGVVSQDLAVLKVRFATIEGKNKEQEALIDNIRESANNANVVHTAQIQAFESVVKALSEEIGDVKADNAGLKNEIADMREASRITAEQTENERNVLLDKIAVLTAQRESLREKLAEDRLYAEERIAELSSRLVILESLQNDGNAPVASKDPRLT